MQGLQIDFDAATPGLDRYRAFLEQARPELPPGIPLSITGMPDWCPNGDPAAPAPLGVPGDEGEIHQLQGRTTPTGPRRWWCATGASAP